MVVVSTRAVKCKVNSVTSATLVNKCYSIRSLKGIFLFHISSLLLIFYLRSGCASFSWINPF